MKTSAFFHAKLVLKFAAGGQPTFGGNLKELTRPPLDQSPSAVHPWVLEQVSGEDVGIWKSVLQQLNFRLINGPYTTLHSLYQL